MIKINNECVQMPSALSRTNNRNMAHSDGLNKHTVLVMWKILEMKKIFLFLFCLSSVSRFLLIRCFRMPQQGLGFILNLIL